MQRTTSTKFLLLRANPQRPAICSIRNFSTPSAHFNFFNSPRLLVTARPPHLRRHTPLVQVHSPRQSYTTPTMSVETVEAAKKAAAFKAVEEHFEPSASYVGIGSGTTIVYVVDAIKTLSTNPHIRFVPTGYQSRQVIVRAGLTPIAFDSLPANTVLDVAFDGADEVDDDLNCIKGGGACLFQEKLVAERAKKFVCVADYRKDQSRLLSFWKTIPIEVAPIASPTVITALVKLGSVDPKVREGLLEKAGPIKTDQDFFIIDAPFPSTLLTKHDAASVAGNGDGTDGAWEVTKLSAAIKSITGVLEVGLFAGMDGTEATAAGKTGGQKPVAVYFGMSDGSVKVKRRELS